MLCLIAISPAALTEVVLLEDSPREPLLPSQQRSRFSGHQSDAQQLLGASVDNIAGSNASNVTWIPADCQVTSWQPFSPCSRSCGGGTQHRLRNISATPDEDGVPCPVLRQDRECGTRGCGEDAEPAPDPPPLLFGSSILIRSASPTWQRLLTASASDIRRASTTTPQSPTPKIPWVSGTKNTPESAWVLVSPDQKTGPVLYGNRIQFKQRASGLVLWVVGNDAVKLVDAKTCADECEFSFWKAGVGASEEHRGLSVAPGRLVISRADDSGYLRGANGGRLLLVSAPTAKWLLEPSEGAAEDYTKLPKSRAAVAQQKFAGNPNDWIDLGRPIAQVTEATSFTICAMLRVPQPATGSKQPLIDAYEWGTYLGERGKMTFYVHSQRQWMILHWPTAVHANRSTHFCAVYNADLAQMELAVDGQPAVIREDCAGRTLLRALYCAVPNCAILCATRCWVIVSRRCVFRCITSLSY